MILLRALLPYLLAAAVGALLAGVPVHLSWRVDYAALETAKAQLERDVAAARAAGEAAGRAAEQDNIHRAQEAANGRAVELAAIATRADDQLRGVLRLCRNPARPVPAAGAGGGPHAPNQPAAGAGVVPGGLDPAGAVADLDVEFIRDRLNRAEQVAADLRTCMAAWPRE